MVALVYFACVVAAFGGFLLGYDSGAISGVIEMESFVRRFSPAGELFKDEKGVLGLAPHVKGMIVSALIIGAFAGSFFAGVSGDKFGRRKAVLIALCFYLVSQFIQTMTASLAFLVVARVCTGFAIGQLATLVPLYQSEIAPANIRGTLVSLFQLWCTLGILSGYIINYVCMNLSGDWNWRVPIGLQIVFGVIIFVGMVINPESPRWLESKGRMQEARNSYAKLFSLSTSDPAVERVIQEYSGRKEDDNSEQDVSFGQIFKPQFFRIVLIGVPIQMFQQLTGINFVIYYGISFFEKAGFTNKFLLQILTGFVNSLATLPAIWLVEKKGRKMLLVIGAVSMALSHLLIAGIGATYGDNVPTFARNLTLVGTYLFIGSFAVSWGPVPFIIASELFPQAIRSKAMSVALALNWTCNFGVSMLSPMLQTILGVKICFIWGIFCALAAIYVSILIPETKGKTLEEIQMHFNKEKSEKSLS